MMSLPQGELYANLVFHFYWRKDLHPDFESFQYKAQMQALVSLGCIGTTLSLGPKTIYQMVIVESTKYLLWDQLSQQIDLLSLKL